MNNTETSTFDFKARLRAEVERSGLTQRAFAEKINVPQRTFESWLIGERTPTPFTQKAILAQAAEIEEQPKED